MDTESTPTRWLDSSQMSAWLNLVALIRLLPAALDSSTQQACSLSLFEYVILAKLSEAPDRTLPMGQLARATSASPSKLTHAIQRLQGQSLVTRRHCSEDHRVVYAQLTETGWDKVRTSAPSHVEHVRQLVFDQLSPEDVQALDRIAAAICKACDSP